MNGNQARFGRGHPAGARRRAGGFVGAGGQRCRRALLIGAVAAFLQACGAPAQAPAPAAPAHVENPVAEAALTTITLTPEAVQRLAIETAAVERRAVPVRRSYPGTFVVPEGRSVTISAPLAGSVEAPEQGPLAAPGGRVAAGQQILRLVPTVPPGQDLSRLEAEAEARFEAARAQATRAELLLRDRAGSQRDYEQARADLAVAEAALQAIRAQLRVLNATTGGDGGAGTLALVAPRAGRLGALHVAPGQPVAQGAPLFEVFVDDPLWVRVAVYVGDLASIDANEDALVTSLGGRAGATPATALTARPVAAPPSANPTASSVDLVYEIRNAEGRLRAGERVVASLALGRGAGATELMLVVDRRAVLYDALGGAWVYESPAEGQFVRRRVDVSHTSGELAVLARGPEPGTTVVVVGAAELFGTEFGVSH